MAGGRVRGAARAGDLFRDDDVAGSVEELNAEVDRAGAPINPYPRVR
jgi:hypothetical protein